MRHSDLLGLVKQLPEDYRSFGEYERDDEPDCSSGCKFFLALRGPLGSDWGVCANPKSHRVGLLTFEHQGCPKFEQEETTSFEYLSIPVIPISQEDEEIVESYIREHTAPIVTKPLTRKAT